MADLFEALRREGFQLRPDDYLEVVQVLDAFQPQSPTDLQALIAPLIVSSDEEQEKFDRIFEREDIKPHIGGPETDEHQLPWIWIATGLLGLLAFVYVAFLWPAPTFRSDITLVYQSAWPYEVGDTLIFGVDSSLRQAAGPRVHWQWKTSDSTRSSESDFLVVPKQVGSLVVNLRSQHRDGLLFGTWTDSLRDTTFSICGKMPVVQIDTVRKSSPAGSIRYQFTARIIQPSTAIQLTQWRVNGTIVAQNQPIWERTFPVGATPAYYDIRFEAIPNKSQRLCFGEAKLTIGVQGRNAPTFTFDVQQTGNLIVPKTQLDRRYYWALWALSILFILLVSYYVWLFVRYKKKKESESSQSTDSDNPLARFISDEPPLEIPIENREAELIIRDQPFYQLIRTLRQPTEGEIQRLHVARTMQATIREGGFPTLVFQPHMAETEYLFLIDRSQVRSQQVALFDYLFRTFVQENVCVERFFFHKTFDLFTNEKQLKGLTLRQLADRYRQHTLIIWSNGYPLLYPPYPVVEPAIRDALTDWESRAILTPVPFADWGSKERALQADFLLLPADLIGQLRLIQALYEKQTYQDTYLQQQINELYSIEYVDFQEVDELRDYLGEELFQWLAALAVYARVRWEIVIEMGRALLPPETVNFTNLLKLARISWMYEGNFPDYTRLELLKALRPENEVKARQTLLHMLAYAEQYFLGEHFYDGEKYLLQTVNQFTLYAHDSDTFADYQPAQQAFKKLYEKGLYSDGATLRYLENPNGQWSTLLPSATSSVPQKAIKSTGRQLKNASLHSYLDNVSPVEQDEPPVTEPIEPTPKRVYMLGAILLLQLIVLSAHLWVWYQSTQPQNQVQDLNQHIPVTIVLESNTCVTALNTSVTDDSRWTVSLNDSLYSISNLYATRSLPLTALASGTTTDFDDETSVTSLRATVAVNDTAGGGEEQSITVPLTRDTLRVRINCPIASTISPSSQTSPTVYIQYASRNQADAARQLQARLGASGFNVPGIELRDTFRDSTQVRYFSDQDRSLADSVAVLVKALFKLRTVREVKVEESKKASLEVWINNGAIDQPFTCQSVPTSWFNRFNGWQTTIDELSHEIGIFGNDVSLNRAYPGTPYGSDRMGTIQRICQRSGVYLVQAAYYSILVRNINRVSCNLAIVNLNTSLLNGPQGQIYFDRLLRNASFRRYTTPNQTKIPTINTKPYSSTAPSDAIYSQTVPDASNRGMTTKTEVNDETTQRRLALIIGNADYREASKLRNPVNDANDMRRVLLGLGFEVNSYINQSKENMQAGLRSFFNRPRAGDVVLVYYSGSGLQLDGENYLLPVDADISDKASIQTTCIKLSDILERFIEYNTTNLLFIDACRIEAETKNSNSGNNINRGLAAVEVPANTLVAYAASPGGIAYDGSGRNGTYTEALLAALRLPNLTVVDVLSQVSRDVNLKTNGNQVPWFSTTLESDLLLNINKPVKKN